MEMIRTPAEQTVGRNPWQGRGLIVTATLLLGADRSWDVHELAAAADCSAAMVSQVITRLRAERLLDGESRRGRRAAIAPTRRLFWATAPYWPVPTVRWMTSNRTRVLRESGLPTSGGAMYRRNRLAVDAPPRLYVHTVDQIHDLIALHGGTFLPTGVRLGSTRADAELIDIVEWHTPPGLLGPPLPRLVVALEVAGDPRGDEVIAGHPELLTSLPEEGTS